MSIIDEAIKKYGGGDAAYEQKLKEHIRDGMGYSNYVDKANAAAGKPLSLNLKGNITPEGVSSLVSGAIGMRQQQTENYSNLAGKIDTAAGTLASEQISASKRASDQARYDSSFVFNPNDDLDRRILDYTINPKNEEGSIKTVEQFENELNAEYAKQAGGQYGGPYMKEGVMTAGYGAENPQFSKEDIKNRILERLPADYIGKEIYYTYRFQGFTEKQATEEQLIDFSNMIVNGQGDNFPKEMYPLAYNILTDAEKAKVRRITSGRSTGRSTGFKIKI